MGVCIEELPDIRGCQVMVSINQCRPSNGTGILKRVTDGFEQIFGRLRLLSEDPSLSKQGRLNVKQTVLNDIIALCHKRILIRLRSRHAKPYSTLAKHKKRFLGSVIRDFMAIPWHSRAYRGSSSIGRQNLKTYRAILDNLLGDLDRFEAMDVVHHQDVLRLVKTISQAVESVPVSEVLAYLDDNEMCRDLRAWLVGCLNKVHRYSETASILCHSARRIPMLRNIRVRAISGLVGVKSIPVSTENDMDICQSLARFQYMGNTVQVEMLPEWLRVNDYAHRVRKSLEEAKVHAEVQLLAYYEYHHFDGIRPRILASSKKACALCNAFISSHGVYRVPKSHGRLYRGWKLPAVYQKGPMQDHLNQVLEKSISETLPRLMALPKRPRIGFDKCESSIFSFSLSASTLTNSSISAVSEHNATLTVAGANIADEVASRRGQQSHGAEKSPTERSSTQTEQKNEDTGQGDTAAREAKHAADRVNVPVPQESKNSDGSMTRSVDPPGNVRLRKGQAVNFNPGQRGIACFRSRRIELLIDEASSCFSFELLSTVQAEQVLSDETKPVVDVRTLSSGLELLLKRSANGQTYISNGDEVIRICTRAE